MPTPDFATVDVNPALKTQSTSPLCMAPSRIPEIAAAPPQSKPIQRHGTDTEELHSGVGLRGVMVQSVQYTGATS